MFMSRRSRRSDALKKDMRSSAMENAPRPNEQIGSTDHVVDYATQSGSTLLPMLVAGIVMIVIGMIVVAATS